MRVLRGLIDEYLAKRNREGRAVNVVAVIAHTVIIVCLLSAYVTLTLTGHDGSAVLGVLGGYSGGSVLGTVLTKASGTT